MYRTEMKCTECVKFDTTHCRLNPVPLRIPNPSGHWCSQGLWHRWSDRYEEFEPYYWGDWEDTPPPSEDLQGCPVTACSA